MMFHENMIVRKQNEREKVKKFFRSGYLLNVGKRAVASSKIDCLTIMLLADENRFPKI